MRIRRDSESVQFAESPWVTEGNQAIQRYQNPSSDTAVRCLAGLDTVPARSSARIRQAASVCVKQCRSGGSMQTSWPGAWLTGYVWLTQPGHHRHHASFELIRERTTCGLSRRRRHRRSTHSQSRYEQTISFQENVSLSTPTMTSQASIHVPLNHRRSYATQERPWAGHTVPSEHSRQDAQARPLHERHGFNCDSQCGHSGPGALSSKRTQ